ncbi:MAG: hypothetical protein NDJ92_18310 [Thermoanaerobaculia bacterium]|nr:hypothetical protein [Thermoanaerobaculia bacterium]
MAGRILLAAMIVALALNAGAQEITVSEAIVPVVGAVVGLGNVVWSTDVALRNPMPYDVEVVLSLVGVPDDPFLFTTIRAGDAISLPDTSRQTFGVAGKLAPLRVQTLAATSVAVAAVVYGMTAEGPTEPEVLTVQYGKFRPMLVTIPALNVGEQFRTNIGLVNPSENEAIVVLALQKVPGRNIGVVSRMIPPRTHLQVPLQSIFPLLTEGENMSLVVEHTNPEAYVYASVVANATHNARYLGPR